MSDAFTDVARDEMRNRNYANYLHKLEEFCAKASAANRRAVVEAAKQTDNVPRGFFGSKTSLDEQTEPLLISLKKGDRQAWAKLLFSLMEDGLFQRFQRFSPFSGQLLIAVEYGRDCVYHSGNVHLLINGPNFRGNLRFFVDSIIKDGKGWMTYDADNYLVVFSPLDVRKAEVFWVGSGFSGVLGPRPSNTPRHQVVIAEEDDDDDYGI